MAMTSCVDCGKEISDRAWKCPHCGRWYPTPGDEKIDRGIGGCGCGCLTWLLIVLTLGIWFPKALDFIPAWVLILVSIAVVVLALRVSKLRG